MDRRGDQLNNPLEQAGYLEFRGAHIYSVLHGVTDPVARALLIGPFPSERYFSYIQWVRWARFLAARGIEALRFDYRGVGESTGVFEDMSFDSWNEDVQFLAGWLNSRSPDVPLILHGLELGALLANKTFASGVGDALLLWSAPSNANEVLRRPLSRQVFKSVYERRPLADYVRQLETDQSLDVEGYQWSGRLWRDSFQLGLPLETGNGPNTASDCGRPVRLVKLERGLASSLKGSPMGYVSSLNPDLSHFFTDNFEWMAGRWQLLRGGSSEKSH